MCRREWRCYTGSGRRPESRPETRPSIRRWVLALLQSSHTEAENQVVSNTPQMATPTSIISSHRSYFNYFQGCWVESLALLHNFAMDCFVNLIPYHWEAHDVVLNFCRTKCIGCLMRGLCSRTKTNHTIQIEFLTLHCAFCLLKRDLLVDDPPGTLNSNFLQVVYGSLLWTLQPRSCYINK